MHKYILILLLGSGLFNQAKSEPSLLKDTWQNGWYLLFGLGPSGQVYSTESLSNRGSIGPHIQSHLGFWAYDAFGIEIGSSVGINFFDQVPLEQTNTNLDFTDVGYAAWSSSFYIGIRVRIPAVEPSRYWRPYVRLYQGIGQSVGFFLDDPPGLNLEGIRVHNEGNVMGIAFGNLFDSLASGKLWFLEFSVQVFILRTRFAIQGGGVLPIELGSVSVSKDDHIIKTSLSFGMALF